MIGLCCNLAILNLSNCSEVDPLIIMSGVEKCKSLTNISLVNCVQFSEQQMTQMLSMSQNLEYIDCTGTQEMIFCNGLTVVCSLWKLHSINLEPKYTYFERHDWERLVRTFYTIQFGHSIMRMFPHYGRFL